MIDCRSDAADFPLPLLRAPGTVDLVPIGLLIGPLTPVAAFTVFVLPRTPFAAFTVVALRPYIPPTVTGFARECAATLVRLPRRSAWPLLGVWFVIAFCQAAARAFPR